MTAQMIAAIEAALAAGHRVQLKQLRDGTIKVQIVFQKELKIISASMSPAKAIAKISCLYSSPNR